MNGFCHPDYAGSLAEFGTPRHLPASGGWLLERPIAGSDYRDAMGCYPLFVCRDWGGLAADLEPLRHELVSLALVTDPFGQYDEALLHGCFDVVMPFKPHFVADLSQSITTIVSSHHRYYVRKALKNVSIDICKEPIRYLDEWTELYGNLSRKFNVRGIRAFSRDSFKKQLSIPGAVLFRALYQGTAVAAHLVIVQDDICYGHLVGSSELDQQLLAAYALYWSEIEYFSGRARWFDWGAGAGVAAADNGLTRFKKGWATETRMTWFCGKTCNPQRYAEMVQAAGSPATGYFPAYRAGEFG
ncbi:hypothetical protein [Trichlorobacter ammonificans]|uniref:BioF2-like acetyltransferase domain-containing protein n=1 Tax=Trichlorobacter ammonificans TaxID=2916410 RepID=A0ABM9D813_9BACT|nr:hypothetical protein [Trichlorobacter ammonificans]CAH2031353.1 conserved protein of unknown function [Trichlorobacter ammonificans]